MSDLGIRRRPDAQAVALMMAQAEKYRREDKLDMAQAVVVMAHSLAHRNCGDLSPEHILEWVESYQAPTVHEFAAAGLLDPYLDPDNPPDGWHLIDNADADDVRHALEVAIERMRATLAYADHATRGMVHMGLTDRLNGRFRA